MSIVDNFYEELYRDMEFQEYIRRKKQDQRDQQDFAFQIELEAYNHMAKQYFKDLQQFEDCMLEKEYKRIEEWEFMKETAQDEYEYCK